MIQCRCFKCNSALETPRSRTIGLGPDCEENTKLAFEADIQRSGEISGDAIFNLLSVFCNNNACQEAKDLAEAMINANKEKPVTWDTMAGVFGLARTLRQHGDENSVTLIFNALRDIAPAMTAMSLGEASANEALLDYDPEAQKISLAATTVRQGTEELKKLLTVKRFGTRAWEFGLRDAEAVLKIVQIRWPLIKITEAFRVALGLCKALPPLPPPSPNYETYLATEFVVVTYKLKDENGRWLMTQDVREGLSNWFRDTIQASWYRKLYLQTNNPAWLVLTEQRDQVLAKLAEVLPLRDSRTITLQTNNTSAPRRARRVA